MNDLLEISINNSKEIAKELNSNIKISTMTKELENGVTKALDKISNYIIKALPRPDCAKDILRDVKDSLKTGDIKTILSTAVKSSIREGLELIGFNNVIIDNVFKLKDAAVKGGLAYNIKNSVNLISKNMTSNNLSNEHLNCFFYELGNYVQSNKFLEKLEEVLTRVLKRKENFLSQVKEWYKSYENMDIDKMTNIASKLKRKKDLLIQYPECERENGVIQNITSMVSSKKKKLSEIQLQLCSAL